MGQVEFLSRLPARVVVPQAVAEELSQAPGSDPARRAIESGLFQIIPAASQPKELLAWDLGAGETAVLAYALAHPKWIAILDDGMARRCALSFSLPMKGTLAVIILAKQHGLIESAAQVLYALCGADFRLEDVVIREALARTVGEVWKKK